MFIRTPRKCLFGLLSICGALVIIGCGDDRACFDIGESPIVVRVIDAETRIFICDASVLIADGTGHSRYLTISHDKPKESCGYYLEGTSGIDFNSLGGIVGVTVTRSGYRTAMRMIQMAQDECGLIEQTVQFELVPE